MRMRSSTLTDGVAVALERSFSSVSSACSRVLDAVEDAFFYGGSRRCRRKHLAKGREVYALRIARDDNQRDYHRKREHCRGYRLYRWVVPE